MPAAGSRKPPLLTLYGPVCSGFGQTVNVWRRGRTVRRLSVRGRGPRAEVSEAGFRDLRAAHAAPFMVMDVEGTRASQLAARAGMTKQAMGELVAYLTQRGYLETVPDPSDGRARLVRLTARGWQAVAAGVEVITAFEVWLQDRLGAEGVRQLRRNLHLILEADIP